MSFDPSWEVLIENCSEHHADQTACLRIQGGWLYREQRETYDEDGRTNAVSITFVPLARTP